MRSPFRDPEIHRPLRGVDDASLVARVNSKDTVAWHEFVYRVTPLIRRVLDHHVFSRDEDEIGELYVDVLKGMYERDLERYSPSFALSTFVVLVTRRRVVDRYRKARGRKHLPAAFNDMSELQRRVYRLFFVEGLDLTCTLAALNWNAQEIAFDEVVEAITHIEDHVDSAHLRNLSADRVGTNGSGLPRRELEFIMNARLELERKSYASLPDQQLIGSEASAMLERVRKLIEKLPPHEREVIELKLGQHKTAKDTSDELSLGGPRTVYTIVDRVVRRMRRALNADRSVREPKNR